MPWKEAIELDFWESTVFFFPAIAPLSSTIDICIVLLNMATLNLVCGSPEKAAERAWWLAIAPYQAFGHNPHDLVGVGGGEGG